MKKLFEEQIAADKDVLTYAFYKNDCGGFYWFAVLLADRGFAGGSDNEPSATFKQAVKSFVDNCKNRCTEEIIKKLADRYPQYFETDDMPVQLSLF